MKLHIPNPDKDGEFTTIYRASVDELEPAYNTRLHSEWILRTQDPLKEIMRPGYFDSVISHGLRRNDSVRVIANFGKVAEHALLTVDDIRDGRATVSTLIEYRRPAAIGKAA